MKHINKLLYNLFSTKSSLSLFSILFSLLFILIGCENEKNESSNNNEMNLLFVASEGNFGQGNGSISVFDSDQKVQEILDVGDVVQSILIHENHLFVIVNGSSEIKRYSISKSGLILPGITISTQNSSPREMVIFNNKLYFTNWNSKDIKVLNLTTYAIIEQISVEGLPEDITTDGTFLYASVPHLVLYDQGNGSSVIKIDPNINEIIETYEVGKGPQQLVIHNNSLWISRTYYSEDWYQTYFGMTQVDLMTNDITKKEYGEGIVCGGNVMVLDNQIYRTSLGGIAPIDQDDLSISIASRIGNYPSKDSYYNPNLYSSDVINNQILLGITNDYQSPDTVYFLNKKSESFTLFEVGAAPGDYAIWESPN